MDEHIIFNIAGIKVSRQHFTVDGKAYALKDIESFELKQVAPKRIMSFILLLAGVLFLFDEGKLFAVGGFCVLMGIVIWVSGNVKYSIIIDTLDGRQEVLTSIDRAYIEQILRALDSAILHRANPKPVNLSSPNYSRFKDSKFNSTNDINLGAS